MRGEYSDPFLPLSRILHEDTTTCLLSPAAPGSPALSRLVEIPVARQTDASMGASLNKVIEREPVEDPPGEVPAVVKGSP